MRKVLFAALITLVLAPMAFAASPATGTLSVSATVSGNCTITSPTLTFNAYDALAATATTGNAVFVVKCTKGTSPNILLGQGSNPGTGSTDAAPVRQLKLGTEYLSYSLWQNVGATTAWTNVAAGGVSPAVSISGTNVTVYGTIGAGQDVTPGTYTDSVTATLNF